MLVAVALIFVTGLFQILNNSAEVTEKRLVSEARMLSYLIKSESDIEQLEGYKSLDECRITVVGENGAVLYESGEYDIYEIDHSNRSEINAALSGSPCTVRRYSETYGQDMVYYAMPTELDNGQKAVIRLAVKDSEVSSYLSLAVPFLLIMLGLSIIISVLLAKNLSDLISSEMKNIGASLKSINEDRYRPLNINENDPELYSVLCQINDLNEKTHLHIQAQTGERQKLSMVLDNVNEGIVALDRSEKIIFANNSAYKILGIGRECVGKDRAVIFDEKLQKEIDAVNEDLCSFEYANGDRDYIVTVRRIVNVVPDSAVYRIIVMNDITKEKQMVREKSEFFDNASHELKTPITVIQGHSELLLSKNVLNESESKQVGRIYSESMRMNALISDMLKLSKLEKAKDEASKINVELSNTCREAIAELESLIREKSISCVINGEGTVVADPNNIYQLVINLCTNAVKYNKEGGTVRFDITEGGGAVILKVSDTGIGIAKEHIPRLCERFYRVDKSRSKKTGGTGLGLAIVKHICVQYGAKLHIESEPDMGTCVTVEFKV